MSYTVILYFSSTAPDAFKTLVLKTFPLKGRNSSASSEVSGL